MLVERKEMRLSHSEVCSMSSWLQYRAEVLTEEQLLHTCQIEKATEGVSIGSIPCSNRYFEY